MILGVGGVVLLAGLLAWIAKTAAARGRFALGWATAGAATGVAMCYLGVKIMNVAVDSDASDGVVLLTLLAPPGLLVASMIGFVLALQRLPIKISVRQRYAVDDLTPGPSGGSGHLGAARRCRGRAVAVRARDRGRAPRLQPPVFDDVSWPIAQVFSSLSLITMRPASTCPCIMHS